MRFHKAGGPGASPADTPTTYTPESPVSSKRRKRGQVLTIGFSSFPLDDLAHRRIVHARFPRDGCHSVTVFQAHPAHGGIALPLVLSHAGRKQALQSGPMRPALSVGDFLECCLAFQPWLHLGHERF